MTVCVCVYVSDVHGNFQFAAFYSLPFIHVHIVTRRTLDGIIGNGRINESSNLLNVSE